MYPLFFGKVFSYAFYVVENLIRTSALLLTEEEFFQLQAKEFTIDS